MGSFRGHQRAFLLAAHGQFLLAIDRGWNAGLLTGRQKVRLDPLFAASEHVEVEATWCIYQRMVAACREPDKKLGKRLCRR